MKSRPASPPDARPCRLCGREIAFLETARSRTQRLRDPNLNPRRLAVDAKAVLVVSSNGTESWAWRPHWLTCPKAEEVRTQRIVGGQQRLGFDDAEDPPADDDLETYLVRMGGRGIPIEHDPELETTDVRLDREGGRLVRIRTGKLIGRSAT